MDLEKLGFNRELVKICTRPRGAFAQKMTGKNILSFDRLSVSKGLTDSRLTDKPLAPVPR